MNLKWFFHTFKNFPLPVRDRLAGITIGTRLIVIVGLLSLLALGAGASGLYGMYTLNQGFESVYQNRIVPLNELKTISDGYAVDLPSIANKVRDRTLEPEAGVKELKQAMGKLNGAWKAYRGAAHTVEEDVQIDGMKPLVENADRVVQDLIAKMASKDYSEISDFVTHQVYPATEAITGDLGELVALQLRESDKAYTKSQDRYETMLWAMTIAVSAGILAAVAASMLLVHTIRSKLRATINIARRIAGGDLTAEIETRSKDETGEVILALKDMNDGLARLVGGVRTGVEEISSVAAQIAAASADLSARGAAQAATLEQTAATMEELTSTVRNNSDRSRDADSLAKATASVAVKGGAAVGETVNTMTAIRSSTKSIADIVTVVDDIAFQINILALNAAVEAARVGEQGRGFAVVAAEVRNLARRSAAAAKDIKALVGESVLSVERGSHLAETAGGTITEVVAEVKRVTEIIADIAGASREQSSAIEQVNQAVMQMEQVVERDAELAESASNAAELLKRQAEQLARAAKAFKIPVLQKVESESAVPESPAATQVIAFPKQAAHPAPRRSAANAAPKPRSASYKAFSAVKPG